MRFGPVRVSQTGPFGMPIDTPPLGSERSQGSVFGSSDLQSGNAVPGGSPCPQPATTNGSGIANGNGTAAGSGNATSNGDSHGERNCHGSCSNGVEGGCQDVASAGGTTGNGTNAGGTDDRSASGNAAPAATSMRPPVAACGIHDVPNNTSGSDGGGGSGGAASAVFAGPLYKVGAVFASKEALLGRSGMDKLGVCPS